MLRRPKKGNGVAEATEKELRSMGGAGGSVGSPGREVLARRGEQLQISLPLQVKEGAQKMAIRHKALESPSHEKSGAGILRRPSPGRIEQESGPTFGQ